MVVQNLLSQRPPLCRVPCPVWVGRGHSRGEEGSEPFSPVSPTGLGASYPVCLESSDQLRWEQSMRWKGQLGRGARLEGIGEARTRPHPASSVGCLPSPSLAWVLHTVCTRSVYMGVGSVKAEVILSRGTPSPGGAALWRWDWSGLPHQALSSTRPAVPRPRVIDGVTYPGNIKEKAVAKKQYSAAVARGESAGLVK